MEITHKDRLLRIGAEKDYAQREEQGIEIVNKHKGEQPRFEEEKAKEEQEINTVFRARLYGSRSHKKKQIKEKQKEAANEMSKEEDTR